MIGLVFMRLTVIEAAGKDRQRQLLWRCLCACGSECIVAGVRLRKGETRSCGCLQREKVSKRNTTHGMSKTRLYNTWANMHERCTNPKNKQYADYGGRGITVCAEWANFEPFAEWASSSGQRDDLSIDRINNEGNYEPANCRWATTIEQSRNKRPRKDQKLTDAQVFAIRADTRGRRIVAAQYGIQPTYVDRIKNGKRRAFPTEGASK